MRDIKDRSKGRLFTQEEIKSAPRIVQKVAQKLNKDWGRRLKIRYNKYWNGTVDIIIKDVLGGDEIRKLFSLPEAGLFIFREGYEAICRVIFLDE